jgi:hypothetical protein
VSLTTLKILLEMSSTIHSSVQYHYGEGGWGRTDAVALVAYDLGEVTEDLVQFGDALFDLFDLAFAFLDKLFLELHFRVGHSFNQGLSARVTSSVRSQVCEVDERGTYLCSDNSNNCPVPSCSSSRLIVTLRQLSRASHESPILTQSSPHSQHQPKASP